MVFDNSFSFYWNSSAVRVETCGCAEGYAKDGTEKLFYRTSIFDLLETVQIDQFP